MCKYQIRADEIESLTIEAPFEKWVSTATILDLTGNRQIVVAKNVQLQMVIDADPDAKPGSSRQAGPTLLIQVIDDIIGLWFSNNWTGVNTAISETAPQIQGGTINFPSCDSPCSAIAAAGLPHTIMLPVKRRPPATRYNTNGVDPRNLIESDCNKGM